MKNERTLVVIKPDGVQRSLIGEVIKRYERSGLKLVASCKIQTVGWVKRSGPNTNIGLMGALRFTHPTDYVIFM